MAASERNPYTRGWYWRRVAAFSHRRLIFLDESAVNTAMTPTHGRAPRGERPCVGVIAVLTADSSRKTSRRWLSPRTRRQYQPRL